MDWQHHFLLGAWLKVQIQGNSLGVQWLGLGTLTVRDPVRSLVGGTEILQTARQGQKKNLQIQEFVSY